MLFKPSSARVAKEIYKKAPSIAGTITAAVGDEYSAIKDCFGEDKYLASALIDITAESLIRGIAAARGERFAHKVEREYNKISPTLGALLADACVQVTATGMSQERGMAVIVLSENEHHDDPKTIAQLERFIIVFRRKALEVVLSSL